MALHRRTDKVTVVQNLRGHSNAVTAVSWVSDDKLCSSGDDKTVKVWRVSSDGPRTLESHSERVEAVSWSHGGTLVCSGSKNGVRVWEVPTLKL